MPVGKSVDDYLAALAPRTRDVIDEIRRIVVDEFPSANEAISYDMPTFSLAGRRIVHVAGWNRHVSLYPVPKGDSQLLADLGPYLAGRGTLKFDLAKPIPYDLIRRVVRASAA
jgi:uncharacterized protein YdhG (YjbR/CyaY superfamily)